MTQLFCGPGIFTRSIPSPPEKGCKKYRATNGGDLVVDFDHENHPVRWRFGRQGKLKAFVVYKREGSGWRALEAWAGNLPFETHLGPLGQPR